MIDEALSQCSGTVLLHRDVFYIIVLFSLSFSHLSQRNRVVRFFWLPILLVKVYKSPVLYPNKIERNSPTLQLLAKETSPPCASCALSYSSFSLLQFSISSPSLSDTSSSDIVVKPHVECVIVELSKFSSSSSSSNLSPSFTVGLIEFCLVSCVVDVDRLVSSIT